MCKWNMVVGNGTEIIMWWLNEIIHVDSPMLWSSCVHKLRNLFSFLHLSASNQPSTLFISLSCFPICILWSTGQRSTESSTSRLSPPCSISSHLPTDPRASPGYASLHALLTPMHGQFSPSLFRTKLTYHLLFSTLRFSFLFIPIDPHSTLAL